MTISNLTLFSITDFIDDIIDMKREFSNKALFHMTLNILRFPSFQSVNLLPDNIKQERANHIEEWLGWNSNFLTDGETSHIRRLISYLRNVDRSYEDHDSIENKRHDFVKFFETYTKRRDLDIVEVINNPMFTEWWESMLNEQQVTQ